MNSMRIKFVIRPVSQTRHWYIMYQLYIIGTIWATAKMLNVLAIPSAIIVKGSAIEQEDLKSCPTSEKRPPSSRWSVRILLSRFSKVLPTPKRRLAESLFFTEKGNLSPTFLNKWTQTWLSNNLENKNPSTKYWKD